MLSLEEEQTSDVIGHTRDSSTTPRRARTLKLARSRFCQSDETCQFFKGGGREFRCSSKTKGGVDGGQKRNLRQVRSVALHQLLVGLENLPPQPLHFFLLSGVEVRGRLRAAIDTLVFLHSDPIANAHLLKNSTKKIREKKKEQRKKKGKTQSHTVVA